MAAIPSVKSSTADPEQSCQTPDAEKNNASSEKPASEEDAYVSGSRLALVMTAILLAMFLVALDRTIIATPVPTIANEFHSLDDISWYANAYLITSCGTQLQWGRIYTFYNNKLVFLAAILVFEVGSALCGAAPTSTALIIGRAIAGSGSAGIYSGATVILTRIIPLHKRPMYVGFMGSTFGVASIVGPLLGGAFTNDVSWRWCFYINLPIGGFTIAILILFLHIPSNQTKTPFTRQLIRLDPLGTLVFLPGVISFLLALQWGGNTYPWNNGRIIAVFVVAGILTITFTLIQLWRKEDATIPPRILSKRSVSTGALFALCIGGGMITMIYTIAIWFQTIKKASPVQSGIDTIPMILSLVLASIFAGILITKLGYYVPFMYLSTTLVSIGSGLITTFSASTSQPVWIGYQILYGVGLGTGMQQPSLAAQTVLDKNDVSTGVAIMFFMQSLGGAIFMCISQALFTNYISTNLVKIPDVDMTKIQKMGAKDLEEIVPGNKLDDVLSCYNEGLRRAFIVVVAVSCLLILPALGMEWKSVKAKREGNNAVEGGKPQGEKGDAVVEGESG